jgi:hypothetical protein
MRCKNCGKPIRLIDGLTDYEAWYHIELPFGGSAYCGGSFHAKGEPRATPMYNKDYWPKFYKLINK